MRLGCFGSVCDVEDVAASGFDYIELNLKEVIDLSEEDFQDLLNRLNACHLGADAISWILPTDLDLTSPETKFEDWRGYVEKGVSRSLALNAMIWPLGSSYGRRIKPENGTYEEQTARVKKFIAQVAEIAGASGITVAMEPLGPAYTNYLLTIEEAVAFVEEINLPSLKTMSDLRHSYDSGVPLSDIEKWKDLIIHTHIDIPVGSKRCFPRETDDYDYTEYFRVIQKTAAKCLGVEALHEASLRDGSESVQFMRRMLEKTRKG